MQADIFCRVVDNYGDIGVCWRLARRMAQGHGWSIRLWVDDLRAFARIQPGITAEAGWQTFDGIDVVHWTPEPPDLEPGNVVIEAFACDPPPAFVQAMRQQLQDGQAQPPIWINLEYLSAEPWVESCHGLPSQRPDGLTKYFFFPGFTPSTGGLLREPGLSAERDAFQASRDQQESFLRALGLGDDALKHWLTGARLVSLFCYPQAPIAALVKALADDARPSLLLVPEGVAPSLEQTLAPGEHVRIARVPFVPQPDFDRLLWCADLNFVRGEDSFVRAAWAARPLVWQIYPQEENVHLEKLEAWLTRYPAPAEAQAAIRAWNTPLHTERAVLDDPAAASLVADLSISKASAALRASLLSPAWANWQDAARDWDAAQAARLDLGDSLAEFCAKLSRKR
ncbi:elongation factor P maturation arginine rhamnosyltransferase EarP [Bordetella muralis]|uniref:elongation factor P maturation arginine rhamnosyltransferase EarP n=1 Tax=Bordetella muralis TaxID=1649130 RepID=UPI0039EE1039